MGAETGRDDIGGAVEHERVDQAVAAAVIDVGVGVAVTPQVGGVVGELEIGVGHERAADSPGPAGIGVQDDLVLGRDDGTRAEHLAGGAGMVRDGQVRVGSERPFRGEVQGSGAQRGQDPAVRRDAAGIELVEVAHHSRVGLLVGRDGFGVADADPQQEPAAVPGGDPPVRRGDVRGIVGPYVDDRGGHRDRRRGVQDALRQGEITDRRAAEPEPRRGVSQRLGPDREACPGVVAVPGVEPGPDPAQPQVRVRRAHRAFSAGTISRLAIRPSRSAKRSVRSTWPPGKLPSRWTCTS